MHMLVPMPLSKRFNPVFRNEEVRIQHIVDNKLLNKARGLYKTGLIVANCRVVVEAGKRMAELEKKAKAKMEQKNTRSQISSWASPLNRRGR